MSTLWRWLRAVSIDQWRAIDRSPPSLPEGCAPDVRRTCDRETVRVPDEAGRTSIAVLAVLITVCLSLTLQEYFGGHDTYMKLFPRERGATYWELWGFVWWSGWRVIGYVVLPIVCILLLPGERLRDYHISFQGFWKHLWIYALLFACMIPVIIQASTTGTFRHTYPFYRMANRSQFDLWAWELLYAIQFVSLEFFFRGFMLQALRKAMGANAIFVMLVPYCMIHYGKPMAETLGAIGAGLILGTLAMRTRSIWGGALIHIGVATTMDVLALRGCPPMGSGKYCH